MRKRFLDRFSTFDLVIIALLSAGGVASKPFVRFLAQSVIGTLLPAGTVAGVIYMLWIVLACAIVGKRGTAILVGIVQSILVVVFDMMGNRGLANLLVYVIPGVTLEVVLLLFPRYVSSLLSGFTAGMAANATGSLIVGALFLRLPVVPLLVSVTGAAFSGGLGGIVAVKLKDILVRSTGFTRKSR